ncbi:glutathione S-transferase family protein [Parasphingorhabdus halotolerans]|uniref:Glutathione S-transferase family protein n=1 Tax=Parasphingorhabdus halotolerans TaxID=2725558 RepID=A0A6H2DP90_9SPHN|nr:glutathione S-transferase family protein [Parasphingorhabdus halotolerans]QJB70479.1 glutathione S-transferase family protein [Parasphingorhabdus halotolerans]
MTLTFYTNPMSRGQIVRWALHEAGADYDQVLLDYGTTMKALDYLKVNPMGKVPAIVHDGKTVTECAAICAYLAEVFPASGLSPTENERADYYRWLFFTAGPLEQAITDKHLGITPTEDQQRMAGYGNLERAVDVLDGALSNREYICGVRFTMADVYVGSQVDWGLQFGTLPERNSFKAYAERFRERDAYKAAKAIDMALMPEAED